MQRSYAPRNGAPPPLHPVRKRDIHIYLDADVIDFFKWESRRTGGRVKYQTAINDALRWYLAARVGAGTAE
jgi:uncharacterized protein (DUF4415 family)